MSFAIFCIASWSIYLLARYVPIYGICAKINVSLSCSSIFKSWLISRIFLFHEVVIISHMRKYLPKFALYIPIHIIAVSHKNMTIAIMSQSVYPKIGNILNGLFHTNINTFKKNPMCIKSAVLVWEVTKSLWIYWFSRLHKKAQLIPTNR